MISVAMRYGSKAERVQVDSGGGGGGGVTYTRLWTNSRPTGTFPEQTVTLSQAASDFTAIRIVWCRWNNSAPSDVEEWASDADCLSMTYGLENISTIVDATQHIQLGAVTKESSYVYGRRAFFSSTAFTGITFKLANRFGSSGTSNAALVPLLIDGVNL